MALRNSTPCYPYKNSVSKRILHQKSSSHYTATWINWQSPHVLLGCTYWALIYTTTKQLQHSNRKVGQLTCSSLLAIMCLADSQLDGDSKWLLLRVWLYSWGIMVDLSVEVLQWLNKSTDVLKNKNENKKGAVWCTELQIVNIVTFEDTSEKEQVSRGGRRRPSSPPESRMSTLGLWSASRSAVCPVVGRQRPLLQAVCSSSERETLRGNPKPATIHRQTPSGWFGVTKAILPTAEHSCSALRKAESRWVMLSGRGEQDRVKSA